MSAYFIYTCKIIESETRRMTYFIIVTSFYIISNIIVGLEWSDPLDYVATLYPSCQYTECAKNCSVEYKFSRHPYRKDSQLRLY